MRGTLGQILIAAGDKKTKKFWLEYRIRIKEKIKGKIYPNKKLKHSDSSRNNKNSATAWQRSLTSCKKNSKRDNFIQNGTFEDANALKQQNERFEAMTTEINGFKESQT